MKYRHLNGPYAEQPNERRADQAEHALGVATDRNGEIHDADTYLDVSDLIGNLAHFCARAGLDIEDCIEHGLRGAQGDLEDGPEAARDIDRFPHEEA